MRNFVQVFVKERRNQEAFERLKVELSHAFAAPESTCHPLTAAAVIARGGWRVSARMSLRQLESQRHAYRHARA